MPNPTITAIIVTYNRNKLLERCLFAIATQTRQPDVVLVIDNASTDGTPEWLHKWLPLHLPKATLIALDHNTGGAGGFARGMQVAHEAGYDWIWVMDDDVLAREHALADLLKFSGRADILHGRRSNPNGSPFYWQSRFLPWIGFSRPYPDSVFQNGADIWYTNVACFEGALIHRRVFERIGYADTRYFLAWDDTEFGYRASEFFSIAYCDAHTLIRQRGHDNIDIGVRSLYRASDMYRYFHIRNRFLLIQTILKREPRAWARWLKRFSYHGFTAVLFAKEMVRAAMFKEKNLGVPALWRGLVDGIRGRFGAMQEPR